MSHCEWRPIENAPKDGIDILISGGTYSYGIWKNKKYSGVTIARWDHDHWRGEDRQVHDDWYSHNPTHWMPLPPPPEE